MMSETPVKNTPFDRADTGRTKDNSPPSTASLPVLVGKRLGILDRLHCVSERQMEVVRTGDIAALNELLGVKQRIFNELESVERELDPHRDILPENRKWNSEQERLDCQGLIERCEARLAAILRLDEESGRIMLEKRDALRKEIQKLNGQRASNAYVRQATNGSDVAGPPREHLDLKSK